jgi:DNA mismatch repair protein MutS
MEIDKTTYFDLSVFQADDEDSVFKKINFTRTSGGRDELEFLLHHPYHQLQKILDTQSTLRWIWERERDWPTRITNGTIMVIEKYYTYNFDPIPRSASLVDALGYKLFHSADFSMLKYSMGHFIDFFRGLDAIVSGFLLEETPPILKELLSEARAKMKDETIMKILAGPEGPSRPDGGRAPASQDPQGAGMPWHQILDIGHFFLYRFKSSMQALIRIYHRLDAYYGMAKATEALGLNFPVIREQATPIVKVKGLFHLLLKKPVPYNLQLDYHNNFLFLTGANMAGKSTFIKAVGISVFLAHIGMGVPAAEMELSLFDGLLSNIQVQDNILKGESYFYNEVQRIKNTVLKVSDGKKWLILIDELFKGTNIEDAMNCSSAVIKGLLKVKSSLFVLSTHLYEIGEGLTVYPNIAFRYFETATDGDQLIFSYQLKEGISNDRLGYLILKREKVVEMLEQIPETVKA